MHSTILKLLEVTSGQNPTWAIVISRKQKAREEEEDCIASEVNHHFLRECILSSLYKKKKKLQLMDTQGRVNLSFLIDKLKTNIWFIFEIWIREHLLFWVELNFISLNAEERSSGMMWGKRCHLGAKGKKKKKKQHWPQLRGV